MNTTVVTPNSSALAQIAQRSGLAPADTTSIVERYIPFLADAGEIAREAEGVVVTSVDQKAEIKKSRELRLKLRTVRIGVDKARKDLKADSLKRGQLIDTLANHVAALIEPVETRLDDQEKIAERQEADRKAKLKTERTTALRQYVDDSMLPAIGAVEDLAPEAFEKMIQTHKDAHAHRVEQARKVEEQRQADEKARAAEMERLRQDREQADRDRLAAEETARQEREAREAAERQAQAEKDAIETAARKEREDAAAKLRQQQEEQDRERRIAENKAEADRIAAKRKADADAAEARRIADAKLEAELKARRAAESVAVEALDVLDAVNDWMTGKIGAPPADTEQWQDGHSVLASVRELIAKGRNGGAA